MDALASALSSIRLSAPLLARTTLGENVCVDMPPSPELSTTFPFHYVATGQCIVESEGQSTKLNAGDIVLLPRWPAYRLVTGDGREEMTFVQALADNDIPVWTRSNGVDTDILLNLGFGAPTADVIGGLFSFEDLYAAQILRELPDIVCVTAGSSMIGSLFEAALAFLERDSATRPGHDATACRLLEVLAVETLRTWALDTQHAPGRLMGSVNPTLSRALHAMHTNPGKHWTVGELALIAGRSRSSFAAGFKATVGTAPATYLNEYRYQLAEARLAGTESVTRIAEELGFSSAFAFSRGFKTKRGCTPARYRRLLREGTR